MTRAWSVSCANTDDTVFVVFSTGKRSQRWELSIQQATALLQVMERAVPNAQAAWQKTRQRWAKRRPLRRSQSIEDDGEMIELYKDGDTLAIITTATKETDFIREFNASLAKLISEGKFEGDWEFQLEKWLPQMVDICCKLRGYKTDSRVREERRLIAGSFTPLKFVLRLDDHGEFTTENPLKIAQQ